MPIDVSILSQFKPQQPEPLLNTLAQFEQIRGARQQQEMNALQMQRVKREFEQEESLNKLLSEPGAFSEQGGVDYDFLSRNAPRFNLGGKIPEFAKLGVAQREAEQKLQAARLERQTKEESLFAETGKRFGEQLRPGMSGAAVKAYFANLYNNDWYARRAPPMEEVLTQIDDAEQSGALDDYIVRVGQSGAVVAQQHTIKNIAREANEAVQVTQSQGTSKGTQLGPEFSLSGLKVDVAGVQQAIDMGTQLKLMAEIAKDRGNFDLVKVFQDEAGQFYLNLERQYGREYLDYVRGQTDTGFAASKLALKRAAAPSITNVVESEYAKAGAKKITSLVDQAPQAFTALNKARETLNLINQGITTGFAAEFRQDVDRMKALFKDKTPEQVVRTDLVSAFLGADVYQMMSAFNLGAKNIDSAAEQKYLAKVLTGTIALDKAALQRMTKLRADAYQDIVEQYNEKLANGELDRYMQATGSKLKPINVPLRVNTDAEFERLKKTKPSGTEFVDPDGLVRRLR